MTLYELEIEISTWRDVTKEMLMLECPEMEMIDKNTYSNYIHI